MSGAKRPRGRRGPARVGVAVTVALLAGCGVEPQEVPEPVPGDRLPGASPSAGTPSAAARGPVWGARDGRLVPVFTELEGTGVAARVRALLALSNVGDGPPSAIPAGTRLVRVSTDADAVVLVLSDQLRRVPPRELPLVLGQLVFTATEPPEVRRVHVRAGQVPVVYVDATGRRISRALVREDFAELVQGGS